MLITLRGGVARYAYAVVACSHVLLFAGLVFGWAGLVRMLAREDAYRERCDDADVAPSALFCPAQSYRLNIVFQCGVAR